MQPLQNRPGKPAFGLTGKVLLAMLAVVLVLLLVMAVLSTRQYEAHLRDQIRQELHLRSDYAALDVTRRFELKGEVARQLAARPLTEAFLSGGSNAEKITSNPSYIELNEAITAIQEENEGISTVWVTRPERSFMIADHGRVVEETLVEARPWYADAELNEDITYSDPYEDLVTSELTISLVSPVEGENGRLGYVGLDMHLDEILPFLETAQSPGQELLIISDDGFIIFDPTRLRDEVAVLELPADEIVHVERDGEDLFIKREPVPALNWSVVSAVPESVALEPLSAYRTVSLFLWTAGVTVILLTVALVLKWLLRDIPNLLADIRRAETTPHRITAGIRRKDEVGAIARAVDQLTVRIRGQVAELNYQAMMDPLTDLPNRRQLEDQISEWVKEAEKSGETVAVTFVNLDRFKRINDVNGHAFGDELLVRFSERLSESLVPEAMAGRFSGDEFMVVIKASVEEVSSLHVHLKELHARLSEPYEVSGQLVYVGTTMGAAVYPYDAKDKDELLSAADTALSRAKEDGRDRVLFFSADMKRETELHADLAHGLRTAIENGEFELYCQPQQSVKSGRISGAEMLLRWHHPERGFINPDAFIPVAEQSGQIAAIDEWVIEESVRYGAELLKHHPELETIAVNVNARQLQNRHLARKVRQLLDYYRFPAEKLEIEITESVLLDGMNETIRNMQALKNTGIRLALDDFGSGFSSLNYLRLLPIDRLKIDRTFISRMEEDARMPEIVKTVIALAKALEMEVVAEGVGTESELRLLKEWGADFVQGYLIGRPMPAGELTGFLDGDRV